MRFHVDPGAALVGVADEGVVLPAGRKLNFTGAGVTATDDPANNETDIVIPGVSGQQTLTRRTVAAPYAVVADDYALLVTGTGAVTLPAPAGGRTLDVKRALGGGLVTLEPSTGTIDDIASLPLLVAGESARVVADGSNWYIH